MLKYQYQYHMLKYQFHKIQQYIMVQLQSTTLYNNCTTKKKHTPHTPLYTLYKPRIYTLYICTSCTSCKSCTSNFAQYKEITPVLRWVVTVVTNLNQEIVNHGIQDQNYKTTSEMQVAPQIWSWAFRYTGYTDT